MIDAAVAKLTSTLDKSMTVTSEVLAGSQRAAILGEADRWKADLIMMGSHAMTYGIDSCWVRFRKQSFRVRIVQLKSFIVRTKATQKQRNDRDRD